VKGLLTRGTTRRPDVGISIFPLGPGRDLRKHKPAQHFEYASVAEEPRNRYVAACVQHAPLRRIHLQPGPIRLEISEPKFLQPPPQPSADLAAHLPETLPAQPHLRQGPLQKIHAVRVAHKIHALAARPIVARQPAMRSAEGPPRARISGRGRANTVMVPQRGDISGCHRAKFLRSCSNPATRRLLHNQQPYHILPGRGTWY